MREGWTSHRFDEVFDLQMGKTPARDNPAYWGEGYIWVSIADLKDVKYILSSKEQITEAAVKESGIKVVRKGTAIMSFKLSIGKAAIAGKDLFTNEAIMSFKVQKGFNVRPEFIYYYLKGYKWTGANKAVMGKTLNKKTIASNFFSHPPIQEQDRIIAELDCLSEVIAKKKQQLEELDKLAQSIFYEMFGDPIVNEKGWPVKKLGDVCHHITDGDHMPPPKAEKGVPFITISNIDKSSRDVDFTDTFFVPQEYYDGLKEERKAKDGDLLYTVTGSYGIPVIVNKLGPFCFQRHIALLRPIREKLHPAFLCYWALSDAVKHLTDLVATGIAQKTVGLSSIRRFLIALPPLDLQNEFAQKIESIEKQKELVKQSIMETETLFNSRMDYWFN